MYVSDHQDQEKGHHFPIFIIVHIIYSSLDFIDGI
jgi:hypothetical protein